MLSAASPNPQPPLRAPPPVSCSAHKPCPQWPTTPENIVTGATPVVSCVCSTAGWAALGNVALSKRHMLQDPAGSGSSLGQRTHPGITSHATGSQIYLHLPFLIDASQNPSLCPCRLSPKVMPSVIPSWSCPHPRSCPSLPSTLFHGRPSSSAHTSPPLSHLLLTSHALRRLHGLKCLSPHPHPPPSHPPTPPSQLPSLQHTVGEGTLSVITVALCIAGMLDCKCFQRSAQFLRRG